MSAAPTSRVILRQTRQIIRRPQFRNASTTEQAASKVKETASNTASKASEGLSKVQSSASSAVSGATSSASNALSKIGGRTGRIISTVQSMIPPTIYYGRVGLELGKLMVQGQRMIIPPFPQIQTYFRSLFQTVKNSRSIASSAEAASPEGALNSVRNINSQQIGAYAIAGAQVLGFFTVGTMIGRLKIVGYHGGKTNDGLH